jgi:hypothetical protein
MGGAGNGIRRNSEMEDNNSGPNNRRTSNTPHSSSSLVRNGGPRRPSESLGFGSRSPRLDDRRQSSSSNGGVSNGYDRETPPKSIFSRKTSESLGLSAGVGRRQSSDVSDEELSNRRLSEAGLRRASVSEQVLNEDTSNLRVGMMVWVDGNKPGRIAFIGDVHFAKGEMAGVHLDRPQGKNNGTVGGVMYFQCEARRGIFSRLHRLTTEPVNDD